MLPPRRFWEESGYKAIPVGDERDKNNDQVGVGYQVANRWKGAKCNLKLDILGMQDVG